MNRLKWLSLIWSSGGLFLSSWIVIPAPTFALLPLAVGAPEISPLLLIGHLAGLIFAGILTGLHRSRFVYLVVLLSSFAIVLSSLPLLQIPATLNQANSQFQTILGRVDSPQFIDADPMRSQPIIWTDLIRGIFIPPVRQDHHSIVTPTGNTLRLKIYRPLHQLSPAQGSPDQSRYPGIMAIYGGAWQRGDSGQNSQFNTYMAAQGYTVIAIDYRHAPAYHFPAQLEDTRACLQWIRQNAIAYNLDTDRLAIVGWSAGGHLGLLSGYQDEQVEPPIRAIVSYYGPVDLTAGYYDPPQPDPIDTRAVLETFLGGTPDQLPDLYRSASPIEWVKPGLPPTLLIYGQRDHIVEFKFGLALAERLRSADNLALLVPLPWSEHAFDAIFRGIGNQISLYYTERFLAWALQS
jgi:acetyl esterase/lipase